MPKVTPCIMALCAMGASAFTLPSQTARTVADEPAVRRSFRATAGVEAGAQQGSSMPTAAFAFGAALVGAAAMRRRSARAAPTARRVTMEQIENLTISDVPAGWRPKISLGMARRDAVKQAIARELDDCYFIMAFNKTGMATAELEEARAMFPGSVMVRALKNTLVSKAMEGTEWEEFGKILRGSNMFVFVKDENDLKPTIQAYLKFTKQFRRDEVVEEMMKGVGKGAPIGSVVGGVLRDEWDVISPEGLAKMKDFPTKTELIGKIAYAIKQVPQKAAVGIKQIPTKIAIGTKKIVEKLEEDGKDSVADAVA